MTSQKIIAGSVFPDLFVKNLKNETLDISQIDQDFDWKMIVVYRGKHCPLCSAFLNELEKYQHKLKEIRIDVALVSADSNDQLVEHLPQLDITLPVYFGLNIMQMNELGLYISEPRSEQETDHAFAEPGLFVINQSGQVQCVDISNNPFFRPQLSTLVSGLEWIKSKDYPIRGTYQLINE